MKRILSILVFLSALSVYAEHEYIPYVEEGKVWVDKDHQGNHIQVGISETITINQKEYYKLYKQGFSDYGGNQTPTGDSQLHGYIREEDKRVYVRSINNEQEYLIYDFGAQVGDTIDWATITYTWTDVIFKRYIVVDSIATATYYGKERDIYYVTCIERIFDKSGVENIENGPRYFNDVWIESIGTLQHPIMSRLDDAFRWGATGMEWFDYCYNYNTQEIYPTDKTPMPEFSYPERGYIPFLQEGNAWVEEGIGGVYSRYMIADTTVINEKEYCVIKQRWVYINKDIYKDVSYKTYIREEGKKVYQYQYEGNFIPVWSNTEHLFFDFGAQKGDSIVVADWDEYKLTLVIDSVCQTVLNNKDRDVFYVSYIVLDKVFEEEYIDRRDIWIEGIGSTQTATYDCKWRLTSGNSWFYCFHNYDTGYTYPEYKKMLDFSAVHATQSDAKNLTLYRNGDALMAVFPTAQAGEAITLYDSTGRVVATQPIRTGATTATIDTTALPAGVYIARLNSGATAKVVL